MGLQRDEYKTLEILLTGSNNRTLKGVLNFTAIDLGQYTEEDEVYDGTGAATFVIVVILVYGLSIVLMIGSLAKKNMKLKDIDLEEKQIHRYLSQANDLREKGAKENYRQLKRTIISLVNNIPEGSANNKDTTNMSSNILRSMIAVGSPIVAGMTDKNAVGDSSQEGECSGHQSAHRTRSDSESLKALLEEDEESGGDTQTPVSQGPTSSQPRQCIVSQYGFQPPKTTVYKHTGAPSTSLERPEDGATNRSVSTGGRLLPRVVVSDNGAFKNRALDKNIAPKSVSGNMLSPLEKDSKIICKVDERMLRDPGKSCKLSMDSDGNIWILQASPEPERRAPNRLTPSPALPSPRSLGYESLTESRTPSPNVFASLNPSPPLPAGGSPRSSPRRDRRGSPNLNLPQPRDPPRSPRTGAPSPTRQASGVCCEHKHSLILTATANLLPSGSKTSHHEAPPSIKDVPRNDVVTPTNVAAPPPAPTPAGTHPRAHSPAPPGLDEEELVQITTV